MKSEMNDDDIRKLFRETLDTETSKDFSALVMNEINLIPAKKIKSRPDLTVLIIFFVFIGLLGASIFLPSNQTPESTGSYFEGILFLINKVVLTLSKFQNYITGLGLLLLLNYSFEYFMKRITHAL